MPNDQPLTISITLSPAQIEEVVRAVSSSRAPSISTLIAASLGAPLTSAGHNLATDAAESELHLRRSNGGFPLSQTDDPRLSRSLLRGLSLLSAFGPDAGSRGIVELARDLGMSPSTAHRYALTLVELGLLERCPKTRKYRLPGS